jgi:hypothetical protein
MSATVSARETSAKSATEVSAGLGQGIPNAERGGRFLERGLRSDRGVLVTENCPAPTAEPRFRASTFPTVLQERLPSELDELESVVAGHYSRRLLVKLSK